MTASKDMTLLNDWRTGQFHNMHSGTVLGHISASAGETIVPEKAFSTDSTTDIFTFAIRAIQAGRQVAFCTLVEIRGGSSRPLGAHMAVADDGLYCGYVSGGCTEAAIAAEALQAIASGHDRFVMLGEGSPFFDIVLPCGGGITVAIHILRDVAAISSVLRCLETRQIAGLAYSPAHERLVSNSSRTSGWDDNVFKTRYRPEVRILLSGRSLEVETAGRVAEAAGYRVALEDMTGRDHLDGVVIDEDTAVVLLQHDLDLEMPILEAALAAKPFYIGALGSARTHEKRAQHLRERGHSDAEINRIKAPIGLFAKARDAHSLALSVIAEVAACRQADLSRH